jgi:superfamily II helicase
MLTCIQPYPGSAINKHCLEKKIITNQLDFIKNKMPNRDFLNMTNKMTNKEFLELTDTIAKLTASNINVAKLIYIKNTGKDTYEISVRCPFCSKKNVYKNFYMKSRYIYQDTLFCRNCNMRSTIVSPIFNILIQLNLIKPVAKIYHKLVKRKNRIVWKK